jgi:surfeit locus 1 family protein
VTGTVAGGMYRFALRPRWLLGHLLVLALLVLMVNLGFWQLRRLDQRRDFNARVEARTTAPVVPLDDLLAGDESPEDVEFQRVTVTGRFDPKEEVLIRARVHDGVPGYEVATPLVTGDGAAVVVNRGWIPLADGERWPVRTEAAPTGEVTVTGRVHPSQERGRFGPTDPAEGSLSSLARVDLGRLQQQVPYDLAPVYVDQLAPAPPDDGYPTPVKLPELTEGNHLSYAGQWFIFTVIAAVGWVLLIRKSARTRLEEPAAGDGDDAAAPTAERVSSPS